MPRRSQANDAEATDDSEGMEVDERALRQDIMGDVDRLCQVRHGEIEERLRAGAEHMRILDSSVGAIRDDIANLRTDVSTLRASFGGAWKALALIVALAAIVGGGASVFNAIRGPATFVVTMPNPAAGGQAGQIGVTGVTK